MIWGPFHVSLERQSLHHDFIWRRSATQNFSQFHKHKTTISVVTEWWRFNPPIHSIWMMLNTLFMYEEVVGTIPCESVFSVIASWLHMAQGIHPGFQPNLQTWDNKFYSNDGGPNLPSTTFEWCQTPRICMKRIWGLHGYGASIIPYDFIWS